MKSYVLLPQAIARKKHKSLIRSLVLVGSSMVLSLGVLTAAGLVEARLLFIMIPVLSIALGIGMRRGLKILEENLSTFQLLVSADRIVKKQSGMPDFEIHREQITEIEEKSGTGLSVRTGDRKSFIDIPEGLEDEAELKEILSTWISPDSIISRKERGFLKAAMLILLFLLAFAALWLSMNLAIVIVAGAFLIVYMVSASVLLRLRTDVDPRARLPRWMILFFALMFAIMLYVRVGLLLRK